MTYVLAFAGGLAGSLHCIGMCGGLVGIYASTAGGRPWRRVALYNLGRVATLGAIGAVAGALGTVVLAWAPLQLAERTLAVVAGAVAIQVGLELLGVVAPRGQRLVARLQGGLARGLAGVLRSPSPWAPLAFGTLNAFLPCHLIYGFAAVAAATGSVGHGWFTMVAFGLGTVPAMAAAGTARAMVPARLTARLQPAGGALIVIVGLITMLRAFGDGIGAPHHLH